MEKINIYKYAKEESYYRFRSKDSFFNQSIEWALEDFYLILNPAGLDDKRSNVVYPKWCKYSRAYSFGLSFKDLNIPNGNYQLDEDSTEDEKIIYLG